MLFKHVQVLLLVRAFFKQKHHLRLLAIVDRGLLVSRPCLILFILFVYLRVVKVVVTLDSVKLRSGQGSVIEQVGISC